MQESALTSVKATGRKDNLSLFLIWTVIKGHSSQLPDLDLNVTMAL